MYNAKVTALENKTIDMSHIVVSSGKHISYPTGMLIIGAVHFSDTSTLTSDAYTKAESNVWNNKITTLECQCTDISHNADVTTIHNHLTVGPGKHITMSGGGDINGCDRITCNAITMGGTDVNTRLNTMQNEITNNGVILNSLSAIVQSKIYYGAFDDTSIDVNGSYYNIHVSHSFSNVTDADVQLTGTNTYDGSNSVFVVAGL